MYVPRVFVSTLAVVAVGLTIFSPLASATPGPQGYYCKLTAYTGAPYYVQFALPTDPSNKGICTTGVDMTAGQFTDLTRRCVFDDNKSIAQKGGIVSIYSDATAASASAAQLICA